MKGLTSKEHLFLRVLATVVFINAVAFYNASRYMQTFVANFFETVALITVLTLFVLTVNLEFWWRYLRRTDNQRFWVWDFYALVTGVRQSDKRKELPRGLIMKGLTSKERLFLRVLSVVLFINTAVFYVASRHMQTFVANFFEVIALTTGLTVFVLTIQLPFWWKYLRRADNKRFWGIQKTETSN